MSPILMGLYAGLVTWFFTSLGASAVFLKRDFSRKSLDAMLGFAAGVMLAASFFSLINPALELAKDVYGEWRVLPVIFGFLGGAILLRLLDYLIPHLHFLTNQKDGKPSALSRNFLLIFAITLHNIPEALAVGVAFGAVAIDPALGISSAVVLMFGIGLQNIPEGLAVSVPLMRDGMSKVKSFFFGQLSGFVEPIACMIGAVIGSFAMPILPWTLSFAAGAMIFITVEEVIPEANASQNGDIATMSLIIGFICMMCLDVVFS